MHVDICCIQRVMQIEEGGNIMNYNFIIDGVITVL